MRTLKNRIKGLSERAREMFTLTEPALYIPEEVLRQYKPGIEKFQAVIRKEGTDKLTNDMKMAKGQGEMTENENGVKRESNDGRGRWELMPFEGLEELAKWYEAGAIKYGDRNWEKGVDVQDCTNRMIRHAIKAGNGFMDEGPFAHYAAVIWNAIAAITAIKRNPYTNNHFHDEYLKELGLTDKPDFKKFDPCEFKHSADLAEFQANLALIGIENSGGDIHGVPTDGGFVRADRKDQGAKEG